MLDKRLTMAEMLCTRLCHDLTGPISAVSNGAEFISEDSFNMQNEAVELIVSSAFSAVARLQFYRFAYGRVNSRGEASLDDKKQIVEDFFRGSNIELDWPDQHADAANISVSMRLARLLFNLLIISSGTLLKGGNISVRIHEEENQGKTLRVKASGELLKWLPEQESILLGDTSDDEMDPKTVQMFLTAKLMQETGTHLQVTRDNNTLEMVAVQAEPEFTKPDLSRDGEYHG